MLKTVSYAVIKHAKSVTKLRNKNKNSNRGLKNVRVFNEYAFQGKKCAQKYK